MPPRCTCLCPPCGIRLAITYNRIEKFYQVINIPSINFITIFFVVSSFTNYLSSHIKHLFHFHGICNVYGIFLLKLLLVSGVYS